MMSRTPWWWEEISNFLARFGWGLLFVFLAGVMAIAMVFTAVERELTPLEGVLFQLLVLALGLTGSFLLGRRSAAEAAKELVKPHARSAFRRVWTLYQSLSRLATRIEEFREVEESHLQTQHALDVLEAMVIEQIGTGTDALEDWRDIIPEEVEDLEKRLLERVEMEGEVQSHE